MFRNPRPIARLRWPGLAVALTASLFLPQVTFGASTILDIHQGLPDFDSRSGVVVPPSGQALGIVSGLGANATWNQFGTPQSLIKYGGYLATGLSGDAVTASKNWIRSNKALFRLSDAGVDSLELLNDAPLIGTTGHAVLFRQKFGALPSAQDGMITVAIKGGKIAYVSSSAVGDQAAPGAATITPTTAWLNAAISVGRVVSPIAIGATSQDNSWTVFNVDGFGQPQRARLVGFPTPNNGVRPAFETIVLDVHGGSAMAYTMFVDAQTGQVLFRQNRVNHAVDASPPSLQFFSGSYTDDPAPKNPGPCHPFTVPSDTATIDVVATADVPSNDIVLNLYSSLTCTGAAVGTADTATSPEAIHYLRPGTDPVTYSVRINPFGAPTAPPTPPYSYNGAFITNSAAPQTFQYPPKWKWFTANPPLATLGGYPWNHPNTDTRLIGCWSTTGSGITKSVADCNLTLENLAARVPWDHNVMTNTPTDTTTGNYAVTGEAWFSPLTPGGANRPVSASRDYIYPWTNQWNVSKCSQTVFASADRNDIDASVTNLFTQHNRMHDWSYFLGFTERTFNLQQNNFGLTAPGPYPLGRENDPELGDAQAGAADGGFPSYEGRDNANQITLNDGIPPITNQYLFQPLPGAFYSPCVDGDFDMSVVGHEYTHAISNRMVGGPDASLTGAQAGAMGESWSDLDAVEYLNEYGFVPTNGENPFSVGAYVTGNKTVGIRNYSLDNNPLNYSDVGFDVTGPEVHADGEIWNAVNFDIRKDLITKYNGSYPASNATLQKNCANGQLPVTLCPGNRRWIQIVYDAFLLMAANPSMLDARDAYLAADVARFGGANQTELWRAFARRGMGCHKVGGVCAAGSASSVDTDDPDPIPSFESPNEGAVEFQFKVVDADNVSLLVPAQIFVGKYEADAVPVADTDSTTLLTDKAKFVANTTLTFLVRADGYGAVSFPRFVWPGFINQTVLLTIKMPKNWASVSNGASASGDGTNVDNPPSNLIDDTESTQWNTTHLPDVGGTQVTVALGGGAHSINRVNVSALEKGQGRFTSLRKFAIYTCVQGANVTNPTCNGAIAAGFTLRLTSSANAFPGDVPRPAAPDMILRGFNLSPAVTATHVQLRVLTNQCTGQAKYQGEQDNDSSFSTDCRTGDLVLLPPQNQDVTAAELQVFGSAATVPPQDPVVTVTMTAPATVKAGGTLAYQISYLNIGPNPSSNAKLTDVLPAQLNFVSASGGGTYNATTRTVTWNLGTVPVNASGSRTLTTAVQATTPVGTVIANEADYTADLTTAIPAVAATTVSP